MLVLQDYERIKNNRQPKTEKFGRQNSKIVEWNSKEFLSKVRKNIEIEINKELDFKRSNEFIEPNISFNKSYIALPEAAINNTIKI